MSEEEKKDEDAESIERPEQSASVTLDGPHGWYTVTASTLNLKDDKGKDRASVFSVAYILDEGDSRRPITFCFNGGPGSSSVWLQFGAFGPKRVDIPDEQVAPPPPNPLVDNPHGLLDLTDLVFIDPVGTGFSRPAGKAEAKEFHGIEEDVTSVGEFIWRWLSRYGRWQSPKFLAGESYGTTRAGALVNHLQDRGIACNGLVLLSVAMNFQTLIEEAGNDLPYVLYLPTLVAVAHYHGRIESADLDGLLDEVRTFAFETYAPALLQGSRLDGDRKRNLAEQLSAWTSLPADEILRRNLRIPYLWFARNLLGPGVRTVGRLDGRYVGPDQDPVGPMATRDPSYDAALAAYTVTVNDFLRREVGWSSEEAYEVLSLKVNQGWKWQDDKRLGYPNTTQDLRQALIGNPHLQVLFASGHSDLATPFFAADYTADHLRLHEGVGDRVHLTYYPAGHMMYFHAPSLEKLKADLRDFYGKVAPAS